LYLIERGKEHENGKNVLYNKFVCVNTDKKEILMNRINMIKTVAVLTIVTLALTLTTVASGWQQFRTDEANAGIAADSAPVAVPDGMTICDVQLVLQGAAVSNDEIFSENDDGIGDTVYEKDGQVDYLPLMPKKYDFSTGAGEDKWAYEKQVDALKPGTNDVPSEELSKELGEYAGIEVDDGTIREDVTDLVGKYAAHRFNFSISEDPNNISKINVTWNGKGWHEKVPPNDNGPTLYIWNGTAYEQLATTTSGDELTLTGERTTSISSYINAGNVTVLVVQNSAHTTQGQTPKRSHIETDYVRVVVAP
jgi:hypothetical protein